MQRFNRLVTVTARASDTAFRLTRYAFPNYSERDLYFNDIDRAGLWAGFRGGDAIAIPQVSSDLLALAGIRLTVRLTRPAAFPPVVPAAVYLPDMKTHFDRTPNGRLLFLGPADSQRVSFKVVNVNPVTIGAGDYSVVYYGLALTGWSSEWRALGNNRRGG